MPGFGHASFGHYHFGHPGLGADAIQDLASNALASPSTAQMLGYTAPTEDEILELEIYRFIVASIRTEDQINGGLFLKRFLQGPQTVWETTQSKINDIKKLWNILDIEDEHLYLLKNIVGWTPNLENITDELDNDTLRRLIKNSVALWKERGSEDSHLNLLTLVANVKARIWNWFDLRWVLDETILDVEHQGRDPFMIQLPGPPDNDENYSNLRIVDNGDLNRDLVTAVAKLMRPCNERVLISYINFLEYFPADYDSSQWDVDTYELNVLDGAGSLSDDTQAESVVINIEDSEYWKEYVASWRFKATTTGGKSGVLFYASDADNGYVLEPQIGTSKLRFYTLNSGVWNYQGDFEHTYTFYSNVYYMITVQITPDGVNNKIIVRVDGTELGFKTDGTFDKGKIGLIHEVSATATIADVELYQMPMETDLIDINP